MISVNEYFKKFRDDEALKKVDIGQHIDNAFDNMPDEVANYAIIGQHSLKAAKSLKNREKS